MTIGVDYTVAGDDDWDTIGGKCPAHGAGGLWVAEAVRQLAVGAGLSQGYLEAFL